MFALCIEASHARGYGHAYRMANVARCLLQRKAGVVVVTNRDAPAQRMLDAAGIPYVAVDSLEGDEGWEASVIATRGIRVWVNDRLHTGERHASRIKGAGLPLATFDDNGPGAALADLHIAPLAALEQRSPPGGRVLSGIQYLALDPSIAERRRSRSCADRWIVTLGGADTYGATVKVVTLLARRRRGVTVVVGPGFRHFPELEAALPPDYTLKRGVASLSAELSLHDVAVTGGGMTAFEACASGLPAIVVANEPHETAAARHLESLGCARFAGPHQTPDPHALERPLDVKAMSAAGLAGVPVDGVERVCRELLALA